MRSFVRRPGPNPALFRNPEFDRDAYRASLGKAAAQSSLGIFFTPRSGSSWLTDILSKTHLLGKPQEWFNPNFIPDIARAVNACDRESYIEMLRRKHAPGSVFSFELTIYQMGRAFSDGKDFLAAVPAPLTLVYLTRRDIVLQAISLAKAVATDVFHAPDASADALRQADRAFAYDARAFRHWLDHILDQERRCEGLFAEHGLRPLRLTYESMMTSGADATAALLLSAAHPGRTLDKENLASDHIKIATPRNAAFAARFRDENAAFVQSIEAARARPTETVGSYA